MYLFHEVPVLEDYGDLIKFQVGANQQQNAAISQRCGDL